MNTRNWTAVSRANDFGGTEHELRVDGEVEVASTAHSAALAEAVPQGVTSSILLLDLTVTHAGRGADVMTWSTVGFEKRPVGHDQFDQVVIRSGGSDVATIRVDRIIS